MMIYGFPRLEGELERLLDRVVVPVAPGAATARTGAPPAQRPAVDVREERDGIVLLCDLPGVRAEDIHLTVENGVLTLSGERKAPAFDPARGTLRLAERSFGRFERRFELGDELAPDLIEARADAGVLTVTIPRRPEQRPRTIDVKVQA